MDSSHRASDWGMRNGDPLFTSMISSVSIHTPKCKSLLVTYNLWSERELIKTFHNAKSLGHMQKVCIKFLHEVSTVLDVKEGE